MLLGRERIILRLFKDVFTPDTAPSTAFLHLQQLL